METLTYGHRDPLISNPAGIAAGGAGFPSRTTSSILRLRRGYDAKQ